MVEFARDVGVVTRHLLFFSRVVVVLTINEVVAIIRSLTTLADFIYVIPRLSFLKIVEALNTIISQSVGLFSVNVGIRQTKLFYSILMGLRKLVVSFVRSCGTAG